MVKIKLYKNKQGYQYDSFYSKESSCLITSSDTSFIDGQDHLYMANHFINIGELVIDINDDKKALNLDLYINKSNWKIDNDFIEFKTKCKVDFVFLDDSLDKDIQEIVTVTTNKSGENVRVTWKDFPSQIVACQINENFKIFVKNENLFCGFEIRLS